MIAWMWVGCQPVASEPVIIEQPDDTTPFEGDAGGECANGADDDQDGYFDCDDNGCFGSPDCDATTPPTEPPPTEPPPTEPPPTDTGPTEPPPGALCDFASIDIEYAFLTSSALPGLWPTCFMAFKGSADGPAPFEACTETTVTFDGTWELDPDLTLCDPLQQDLVPQWSGGSYHTFVFNDDLDTLYDWFAHRDLDDASTSGDPVFYITEIDYPLDVTAPEPVVDYQLDEEYSYGGLFDVQISHFLQVTFHR